MEEPYKAEIDPALNPDLNRLNRRSFVERMSASTVVAAALGSPVACATAQSAKDDPALAHETVSFESSGTRVEAFYCRPKAEGKRGSVIVIQEIFGLNDHIRDIACRCAKAGFNGLAVNFFTREGQPPDASGGFGPLMEFVGKIPDRQIMADLQAAAKWLKARHESNGKVGCVGFCWGGRNAMLASALVTSVDACVAYYGRIRSRGKTENQPESPIELVSTMRAPLLGHFGALDGGIPVADADALRAALKDAGKTAEIHVYEGANHAFNNDTRPSYHAESAKTAWKRTLEWFDKYLKS